MVDKIRGLVRPIVTFIVILSMVISLLYLVLKFGDSEMAKDIIAAFLVLVAAVTGFWFGSRKTGGEG